MSDHPPKPLDWREREAVYRYLDRLGDEEESHGEPLSSDEIVKRVAKVACERICQRLIRRYRRMRQILSGDDSPLANVWEEICVQEQQQERSGFWEGAYEASLLGYLEGEVDELDEATRWAIWRQTDAGIDWNKDDGESPEKWSSEELGRFILEHYVLPAAEVYSNARIRLYIARWKRPNSNQTRATQTSNQPSMLSLAKQEIDRIAPVLSEFDPNADTTKIGSWGLLYLICGLAAGRSFHWTSTIPQLIPTGYEAFRQSLSGEPSEIQLAIEFRKLVSKWAQDPAGLAIARGRLADLERDRGKPLADNLRQHYLDSTRLRIMLNSLSDLEIDDLTAIRRWASQHDQGWPILFYAAGILLSVESAFPSQSLIYGVLGLSHSAKDKVKLLLGHYSHRDSWKSV
jgi:hypothetical protein